MTAAAGAWAASSTPTITGITVAVPVSITGGQYRINGGAWTTANGTISAGQTVQVQVQAPSAPGSSQTATLTVGGVSDTFQVSVQSDIDPDALTFGDITIHSNEPDVWGGTDSLITGINQPIVLRIERYGYNGNLDAAYIDYQVFDTGGAMVDSGYFDVRGTDPNDWRYRDVTVQNGYRVKYFAHVATNSGTQSAGWNVTVWNKTKGDAGTPTVLSQKTVSVTVDADNNHNVDDYTPDAFNDFVDQNAATNDPTIWFGPAQTVTGINKPITLRVQRYNYSGDIHDIGVHVYRDSGSGWIHQGTFDPRGGGDQYVDVTVNNGDKIHYAVDARTNEGRRTGTMNMVVFNLSQPGGAVQLSNRSVNVTVDADNNHNVAGLYARSDQLAEYRRELVLDQLRDGRGGTHARRHQPQRQHPRYDHQSERQSVGGIAAGDVGQRRAALPLHQSGQRLVAGRRVRAGRKRPVRRARGVSGRSAALGQL